MRVKIPEAEVHVTTCCRHSSLKLALKLALSLVCFLFGLSAEVTGGSSQASLAPTPVMGWNSWNKFGCNVSEKLIREIAAGCRPLVTNTLTLTTAGR
jgi:hypothetical protein